MLSQDLDTKLWQTIFSTEQCLEGRFLGGICDIVPGVYKFRGRARGTMLFFFFFFFFFYENLCINAMDTQIASC